MQLNSLPAKPLWPLASNALPVEAPHDAALKGAAPKGAATERQQQREPWGSQGGVG